MAVLKMKEVFENLGTVNELPRFALEMGQGRCICLWDVVALHPPDSSVSFRPPISMPQIAFFDKCGCSFVSFSPFFLTILFQTS